MTQEHPITPPPELVEQWMQVHTTTYDLARQASQWGADQELEACSEEFSLLWDREEIVTLNDVLKHLRTTRRPQPPSLKEQAIAALDDAIMRGDCITISDALPTIRRALEALPE